MLNCLKLSSLFLFLIFFSSQIENLIASQSTIAGSNFTTRLTTCTFISYSATGFGQITGVTWDQCDGSLVADIKGTENSVQLGSSSGTACVAMSLASNEYINDAFIYYGTYTTSNSVTYNGDYNHGIQFSTNKGNSYGCYGENYQYSPYTIYLTPPNECFGMSAVYGYWGNVIDCIGFQYRANCTNNTYYLATYSNSTTYYGSDGTAFRYLYNGRIYQINWGINSDVYGIIISSIKANNSAYSSISNIGSGSIATNCTTIILQQCEYINNATIYYGELAFSNNGNYIRGIIFYTNLGNSYECLATSLTPSRSQYIDYLSPPNNSPCYELIGLQGQQSSVINNINFQYKLVPTCFLSEKCVTDAPTHVPTNVPTYHPTNQPTTPTENTTNNEYILILILIITITLLCLIMIVLIIICLWIMRRQRLGDS